MGKPPEGKTRLNSDARLIAAFNFIHQLRENWIRLVRVRRARNEKKCRGHFTLSMACFPPDAGTTCTRHCHCRRHRRYRWRLTRTSRQQRWRPACNRTDESCGVGSQARSRPAGGGRQQWRRRQQFGCLAMTLKLVDAMWSTLEAGEGRREDASRCVADILRLRADMQYIHSRYVLIDNAKVACYC